MITEIVFATSNYAKIDQMIAVFKQAEAPITVVSGWERYDELVRYEEIGDTPEAIAAAGAKEVVERIGLPVVVEDTGLYVAALNERPGVFAGRYLRAYGRAGLLAELEKAEDRSAEIVSAVALALPGGRLMTWVNRVKGSIALEEAWIDGLPDWIAPTADNPFGGGYNSLFIPEGSRQTLASMAMEEAMEKGYREPNFRALARALMDG